MSSVIKTRSLHPHRRYLRRGNRKSGLINPLLGERFLPIIVAEEAPGASEDLLLGLASVRLHELGVTTERGTFPFSSPATREHPIARSRRGDPPFSIKEQELRVLREEGRIDNVNVPVR
jgi:hypothetical protein